MKEKGSGTKEKCGYTKIGQQRLDTICQVVGLRCIYFIYICPFKLPQIRFYVIFMNSFALNVILRSRKPLGMLTLVIETHNLNE